jgi:hypothetical protein
MARSTRNMVRQRRRVSGSHRSTDHAGAADKLGLTRFEFGIAGSMLNCSSVAGDGHLRRLPETGAILFTSHTSVRSVHAALGGRTDRANLASTLETMPESNRPMESDAIC